MTFLCSKSSLQIEHSSFPPYLFVYEALGILLNSSSVNPVVVVGGISLLLLSCACKKKALTYLSDTRLELTCILCQSVHDATVENSM